MGEWSEAMEEGIFCPRCFCLTVDEEGNQVSCTCPAPPPLRAAPFKPDVQRQPEHPMPLGPDWLPPIPR